jgi:hypothetical protein
LFGGDLPVELDGFSAVGLDNGLQAGFVAVVEAVITLGRIGVEVVFGGRAIVDVPVIPVCTSAAGELEVAV